MPLTAVYAALLALLFFVLSIRTIRLRRRHSVGVGYGGEAALERAARAHANCAEYAPIALLLIYFFETSGPNDAWIHGLGGLLVAGRVIHAYGVSQSNEDYRFRVTGMTMTFTVLLAASLGILWQWAGAGLQ
ncbi:MAG: MAPEG family protein [Pseudomonadota bacterium]